MIAEVDLGEVGRHYFLAKMGSGLTLAQHVVELRSAGSVTAYLPQGQAVTARSDFEHGGLPERGARRAHVIQLVKDHLKQNSRRCAIAEDYLSRPNDAALVGGSVQYFTHHEEVFLYVVGDSGDAALENMLSAGWSYRLTLILSEMPSPLTGDVTGDVLARLAQSARMVVVDAWHNEGEVICQLTGRNAGDVRQNAGTPVA